MRSIFHAGLCIPYLPSLFAHWSCLSLRTCFIVGSANFYYRPVIGVVRLSPRALRRSRLHAFWMLSICVENPIVTQVYHATLPHVKVGPPLVRGLPSVGLPTSLCRPPVRLLSHVCLCFPRIVCPCLLHLPKYCS